MFTNAHRRFFTASFALMLATSASGCKRPGAQSIVLTKDQEQQIAENVLNAPPATIQNKGEVKFEDKIVLLGYDLKGTPAKRGGTLDLTLYWRVNEPVSGDWKIFVHFESPGQRRQPFDHYAVGGLYPPGQWKKGEIIKDVINIAVPADWPAGPTQIMLGFFDWGAYKANPSAPNRRLKVVAAPDPKMILSEDRLLLTTLDVAGGQAGGAAENHPPRQDAPRAQMYGVTQGAAAPTIDGNPDDAMWQAVRALTIGQQPDSKPLSPDHATTAKLVWDKDNLYFTATTRDSDARNTHTENDTETWEGDVIELFLQLPGMNGQYVELQFTPNGSHFDAKFTGPREPEWKEAAKFTSGMTYKVLVDGTVNADGDDKSWSVEAAIPWKGLGLEGAPPIGTKMAANIYRIDNKGPHDLAHMGAWAPVGGDFHKLDGAGTFILTQATPAGANAPDGAPMRPALPMLPAMAAKPVELKAAAPAAPEAAPSK